MDQVSGAFIKSYSSSVGKNVMHVCFKAKYCHKVFDERVKKRCEEIFQEVAGRYGINIRELGFDRDHVHITVDAGPNYSPASMTKILKGNSGYRLLREFPYLKRKYFWGSGLWSPAYYFDSVGERICSEIDAYVRNQGKKRRMQNSGRLRTSPSGKRQLMPPVFDRRYLTHLIKPCAGAGGSVSLSGVTAVEDLTELESQKTIFF